MRMREDDRIDLFGVDWKRLPISQAELLQALEQASVHEYSLGADGDQVLGPGNGSCCA